MSPEAGEYLMLWTVRASVACYVIALWRWLFVAGDDGRIYSGFWFASWLLCVIHVICAFHFRHQWNHDKAIQHTADMTERVVGLNWGGGLYINYVFLLCWGCSAISGLLRRESNLTATHWLTLSLHVFVAFMMFNATAIFGPVWWWIPTLIVVATVIWRFTGDRRAGIPTDV